MKKYRIFAILSLSILIALWPAQEITGETGASAKENDNNLTGREKSPSSNIKLLWKNWLKNLAGRENSASSNIVVIADENEVLQGLEGVCVAVSDIEPEVEKYGLTKQNLETDTELQLRQYGIKVLTKKKEWLSTPGIPLLGISVGVVRVEDKPATAAEIRVQLRETVLLLREPKRICMVACTWQRGGVVHVGLDRIKDIRGIVKDFVNMFINDYLAANPKEPEKKKPTVEEYDFEALEELLEKLGKAAEGNDKQSKD